MTTPSRSCKQCGKTIFKRVSAKRWETNQGKYCSRECFGKSQIGKESSYKPPRTKWPTIDETIHTGAVVHWSERSSDSKGYVHVPVTCSKCHSKRTILASHTRGKQGDTFTGYCYRCNLEENRVLFATGPDHPAWNGGIFINKGYRQVQLANLSGRALEFAQPMARKNHKHSHFISEHRLVMALAIGRSLDRTEIVHHKNGNKLDNRPENLEITTHANHRKLDVKYYELWQQAMRRIQELDIELLKCKEGRDD